MQDSTQTELRPFAPDDPFIQGLFKDGVIRDEHLWRRYEQNEILFIEECIQIYDSRSEGWIPFRLWERQRELVEVLSQHQLHVWLKARQLGMTWLVLAHELYLALFRPAQDILNFSKRDDEAVYLVDNRLKGMIQHLPPGIRPQLTLSNKHTLQLDNGSVIRAMPTTAGDSYTATFALIDEADLVNDLNRLLASAKPTIQMGGKLVLLSRTDKSKPQSIFKQIYRAAKQGLNEYHAEFLAWHIHPDRDKDWYERVRRDSLQHTGSLDEVHEQYPATDTEALAGKTLDKRIPPEWIARCRPQQEKEALFDNDIPTLPGLHVYVKPQDDVWYCVGVDPAEGNPGSDDSAAIVVRADNGEQVARMSGKFEPSVFAGYVDLLGNYYNQANVMVERNNHGHAVIGWLRDNSTLRLLAGEDNRDGWLSNSRGKSLLYAHCADCFRDGQTVIYDFKTREQLASIMGATLRAPPGMMDDCADALALALIGTIQVGIVEWFML